jgi:hypothetical protein
MNEDCLIVSGHPHYESLKSRMQNFSQYDRDHRRSALVGNINAKKTIIMFACETLSGFDMSTQHVQDNWTIKGSGKSSLKLLVVLETLLDVLRSDFVRSNVHLVLRLHPKNRLEEFRDYVDEIDQVSYGSDPLELAYFSDIVCGIETSVLTEAALMGVHTISIQPDDIVKEAIPDFVVSEIMMPRTREALIDCLKVEKTSSSGKFAYPYPCPADLIVKSIQEQISIAS